MDTSVIEVEADAIEPPYPWLPGEILRKAFRPEKKVSLLFLKELDALLRPHLLPWCRLVFPMGHRSLKGDYWNVPQGMIKIHLKSGATWHLGTRRKENLFLRGITPLHWWVGHTGEYYEQAARSLKEWCLAQQNAPAVEETPFHKSTEEVVQLLYYVMFSGFMLGGLMVPDTKTRYEGTALDIWKTFRDIYGPERTKREPDFNSHHRLKKVLHWCLENDPIHFSVEARMVHHSEIFEMRDSWSVSTPAMKKKLEGKIPPAGVMSESKLSDEELLAGMLEDLAWEPSPEDVEYNLKNAAQMKLFREKTQPEWDNMREKLRFANAWIRRNGLLDYHEAYRAGTFWSDERTQSLFAEMFPQYVQ